MRKISIAKPLIDHKMTMKFTNNLINHKELSEIDENAQGIETPDISEIINHDLHS